MKRVVFISPDSQLFPTPKEKLNLPLAEARVTQFISVKLFVWSKLGFPNNNVSILTHSTVAERHYQVEFQILFFNFHIMTHTIFGALQTPSQLHIQTFQI